MIRLGLFLYDRLGGRETLPGTRRLDLTCDPAGVPLVDTYRTAFEYSDCWVEDARLVVLNALDAHERGAKVMVRTEAVSARRDEALWRMTVRAEDGAEREVAGRILVNAAGPWVERVLRGAVGANTARRVRLVKGSHIVARKFWDGPQAYLLQNDDHRVIFVNPYQDDFCLIGTTDIPFEGRAEDVAIEEAERAYLLRIVNRYFRARLTADDVVYEYSGVRPLYDNARVDPSAVTRDYVFDIDAPEGQPVLLSVFGGKITTFRKLAERALEMLRPHLPHMSAAWTAKSPLPGGDMPDADFGAFFQTLRALHTWLPERLAHHYARLYGTRAERLLEGTTALRDLGRHYGGLLYERESAYLRQAEWARRPDDVLFRRTKHHLHMTHAEQDGFAHDFSTTSA
jgi:glycerol-3-phosphate dehydrogenase